MLQYSYLLLDADGTLFDFEKAQRLAFYQLMKSIEYPFDEDIYTRYREINAYYWGALERAEVAKEALAVLRFQDLFGELGVSFDPANANRQYLHYLGEGDYLLPGAWETCKRLSAHCTMAIVTNGIAAAQRRRISKSKIASFISHIIVSEEAEAAKPDKRFFDFAFQQCGLSDKSHVLMVGDSLEADIQGGFSYGLDTCWVNPLGIPAPPKLPITATITDIRQLCAVVLQ